MARSDSQIDKPQRGCPKRAELPDVNINTGTQSINTDRTLGFCNVKTRTKQHFGHEMNNRCRRNKTLTPSFSFECKYDFYLWMGLVVGDIEQKNPKRLPTVVGY